MPVKPVRAVVVMVTVATLEDAVRIGQALVSARLAACANIVGPIRSIYRWRGKVENDSEHLLLIKTRKARFGALKKRIIELHGYEVPEIVALPIADGSSAYLRWIAASTAPQTD